ncbi:MAG TPA: SIR2 family protein [Bryobacteraceae bacterium]|nr:hypothetical protein [Bryobacterales bacterium]HRJ19357.1 SIR2 family protein [Bryobacteraceae bacterium]
MPAFILGAGFNIDANAETGAGPGVSKKHCGYPLVQETLDLCFGLTELPPGKSVEDLFAEELARLNYRPVEALVDRLFSADDQIARPLSDPGVASCYSKFFESEFFATSHFLTFNYDSLVETFLFRRETWYPHDGFGLPVKVTYDWNAPDQNDEDSRQQVLHLHGSIYVRTFNYQTCFDPGLEMDVLTRRSVPLYLFDPLYNAANFRGYSGEPGQDHPKNQIIAPVPDKVQGLADSFVRQSYKRAQSLLRESRLAVAIGYSFNFHDRSSYKPLLTAFGESPGKELLVVAPDADRIAESLQHEAPQSIAVTPYLATFREWADAGFPGVG